MVNRSPRRLFPPLSRVVSDAPSAVILPERRLKSRRPAVTLIEVLVSMFIMAIGMLALLTLFPLGAISMGQALKDDRCASTAAMAENVAIAMNIRHDTNVNAGFTGPPASNLVYVDPYGQGLGKVGGVIPRVSPSFVGASTQLADRWFSLPDDIKFSENGTPDTSSTGGIVDRGRRYSYAYLLRQLQPAPNSLVQLYVVVYSGRPTGVLTLEPTYAAVGAAGTNSLVLTWGAQPTPNVKRGRWVLDTSGYFYRVTNIADVSANSMVVEVQQNLTAAVGAVVVMEDVAEVFDKGTSWQP
jgi:Prokaryotic N-terminal methylation motif